METMREPTAAKTEAARPKKTGKGLLVLGFVAVLVLGGLLLAGLLPRNKREQALVSAAQTEDARLPEVNAVRVKAAGSISELELPGSISAVTEASLYSRADGYLRKRLVDIGDRVREGQLLAVIDSPELDQQYQQAKATLAQSKAALGQTQAALVQARSNQHLAEITLQRWQTLVGRGVLSKQEGDEKQAAADARAADVQAAQANVEASRSMVTANEANVQRVSELQSYEQVKAPWAGVITARNVDVGALISSNNAAGRELFRIAQISTLRIFVNVPQTYVNAIQIGMPVSISVQQSPSDRFAGKVVRTSNNLDETTRTLLTEVQAANPQGKLLPGMYATIRLTGNSPTKALLVPGDSLIISRQGSQVAVVDGGGVVHLRKVVIGRDYGVETEVISGLQGDETVITNPSDVVREGAHVKPLVRAVPAPSARPGVPPVAR